MRSFLQRHGRMILGVLSGFDRVRFRGSFMPLTTVAGALTWLSRAGVLLKDFGGFAQDLTKRIRRAVEADAVAAGRPVIYLDRFVHKEPLVQQIREKQGAAASGLIAVLSAVEGCASFGVHHGEGRHRYELRRRDRRCLHYYFYWLDERFGLTQVRLQTWFPFHVHHRVRRNTLKMYDKQGTVLRVTGDAERSARLEGLSPQAGRRQKRPAAMASAA